MFFGANYNEYFPIKNLYKALNTIRPDALLVQISPDQILDNFMIENLRTESDENGVKNMDVSSYMK